ncbi:hypothetical protein T484DRAFT_1772442, partial [Baffinella frigidus]
VYSIDLGLIGTACTSGALRMWEFQDVELTASFEAHTSEDVKLTASFKAHTTKDVKLTASFESHTTEDVKLTASFEAHTTEVTLLAFLDEYRCFISGDFLGQSHPPSVDYRVPKTPPQLCS